MDLKRQLVLLADADQHGAGTEPGDVRGVGVVRVEAREFAPVRLLCAAGTEPPAILDGAARMGTRRPAAA